MNLWYKNAEFCAEILFGDKILKKFQLKKSLGPNTFMVSDKSGELHCFFTCCEKLFIIKFKQFFQRNSVQNSAFFLSPY
jgi:hypothetical protein